VFVHGDAPPTIQDWQLILGRWREVSDPWSYRVLVLTRGAAPNAGQRAELSKVLGGASPRIALVTSSLIARMAGNAFSLFIPDFRVFDVSQINGALGYLDLGNDRGRAERMLSELRTELFGSARA
jgi:hypothetical protein